MVFISFYCVYFWKLSKISAGNFVLEPPFLLQKFLSFECIYFFFVLRPIQRIFIIKNLTISFQFFSSFIFCYRYKLIYLIALKIETFFSNTDSEFVSNTLKLSHKSLKSKSLKNLQLSYSSCSSHEACCVCLEINHRNSFKTT